MTKRPTTQGDLLRQRVATLAIKGHKEAHRIALAEVKAAKARKKKVSSKR